MRGGKKPFAVLETSSWAELAGLLVPTPTCVNAEALINSSKAKKNCFIEEGW
jgi:hypothetical protein